MYPSLLASTLYSSLRMAAALHAAVDRSSGNWSQVMEPQQSMRARLRTSGSFNPSPTHTTGRRSTSASPEKDKTGGSPDSTARRPQAPSRVPTAVANRNSVTAAPAAAAAGAAAAVPASTRHADDRPEDDEVMHCCSSVGPQAHLLAQVCLINNLS